MRTSHALHNPTAGPFSGPACEVPTSAAVQFRLGGELGRRLAHSLHRLENDPPYSREYLLGQISGHAGWWTNFPRFHGDMCGRWLLVESRAHAAAGTPSAALAELVQAAVALQRPDGSFGAPTADGDYLNREKAYGNGWMLKGLCAYAQAFDDAAVAAAAERLGAYYQLLAPHWAASVEAENASGAYAATRSCFYHGLDGLVSLARLSGKRQWRDLAASFVAHLTPLAQADHAHMYLTIRRGLLALHELDGDVDGMISIEEELDAVWNDCVLETGGVPERFWLPAGSHGDDEACTLADWLLLTSRLFVLTGHGRWNERALLCLENHLYYNQCYNGGFGSCELGGVYKQQGKEAPWCCSLAVPAALITVAGGWLRLLDHTLEIAHIFSGDYLFADGQRVGVERDDAAGLLRVDLSAAPEIRCLRIARPHWLLLASAGTAAAVIDIEVPLETQTVDVALTYRLWSATPGRAPEPTSAEGVPVTLFHGPWMLSHHHHQQDGNLPVRLRRERDGRLSGARVVQLKGLTYAGDGLRVSFDTERKQRADDVFRGIGEADGEVWTYCLKDKESPNQSRVTFVVGKD